MEDQGASRIEDGGNVLVSNQTPDTELTTTFQDTALARFDDYAVSDVKPIASVAGHESSALKDFLSRPLIVDRVVWQQDTLIDVIIKPLDTLLNNPAIKAKINGYNLFKFDLKIKVVLNGMPFHQGRLNACWAPLPITAGGGPDNNAISPPTTSNLRQTKLSMLPGTRGTPMSPTVNDVYEMTVPFFMPADYFRLPNYYSGTDIRSWEAQYGTFTLTALSPLRAANGLLAQDATVTTYAWFDNIELIVPTILTPQSQKMNLEEMRTDGVLSTTASAFASAAGQLKGVPIIGPYAAVGSRFLGKAAKVLRIFGFSRQSILTDTVLVKSKPFSPLAVTSGAEDAEKLTIDPKQGLCVDPGLHGLAPVDNLSIEYITRQWSFISSFEWLIGSPSDTLLASLNVTPTACSFAAQPDGTLVIQHTNLSFATIPFEYWSGTLEYKLIFATSQYHRGRAMISYEPFSSATSVTDANQNYNIVVDLSESNEISFTVAWCQGIAYLRTWDGDLSVNFGSFTGSQATQIRDQANGQISVRILNELTGPAPTGVVDVLLFIRAGEDFEVSQPTSSALNRLTYFPTVTPQSSSGDINEAVSLAGHVNDQFGQKPAAYFGERIVSFRTLLKRYTNYRLFYAEPVIAGAVLSTMPNVPFPVARHEIPYPDSYGWTGDGTSFVNTPYLSLLKGAYAGWKGGIRWKTTFRDSAIQVDTITAFRDPSTSRDLNFDFKPLTFDAGGAPLTNTEFIKHGFDGASATTLQDRHVIEYEVPFYNQFKFCTTKEPLLWATPTATFQEDDNLWDMASAVQAVSYGGGSATRYIGATYVATGEDFDLLWYLGPPLLAMVGVT